jgi:hypothetical protein
MKRIGMLATCLAAFLALAGLGATAASAGKPQRRPGKPSEHEVEKCKEAGKGECKTKTKSEGGESHIGKYECTEECGELKSRNVTCARSTATSEIIWTGKPPTSKTTRRKFTFEGCTSTPSTGGPPTPCQNTPTPGQILSEELIGTLGYVSKKPLVVGESLKPANKEGIFLRFECPPTGIVVGAALRCPAPWNTKVPPKGSECTPFYKKPIYPHGGGDTVIATVEPLNVESTLFIYHFTCERKATEEKNIPSSFLKKPLDVLETAHYELANPVGTRSAWESDCIELEQREFLETPVIIEA